jgi:hypothetical protein
MSHSITFAFTIGQIKVQDQLSSCFDYLNILHDFGRYYTETIANHATKTKMLFWYCDLYQRHPFGF